MICYWLNYETPLTEVLVKAKKYYYLDTATQHRLDEILRGFMHLRTSNHLWENLCSNLPVQKWSPASLRLRVEGLAYAAERLWNTALEDGKRAYGEDFDRDHLRRYVRTLPMSHYHYLVGSRESKEVLRTRHDALEDPLTALAKLQSDIAALADFLRQLPEAGFSLTGGSPSSAN